MQGVGGAVQYPRGLLKEMFALAREKGGVCIADEVQTGFGRLGSHFWGFESHDLQPDIGKKDGCSEISAFVMVPFISLF